MIQTELYFGLGRMHGPAITHSQFSKFLDHSVTPLFKDGLTLVEGKGQFRLASGLIVKEGSKVLVLVHDGSSQASRNIDVIRDEYKRQYQQESVLRSDVNACISF